MDPRKYVYRKTVGLLLGEVVCCGVMIGIYALLGKLDGRVLLGSAVGALLGVLNFFVMAMNATQASDKAVHQDVKGGVALMRFSYVGRLALIFAVLLLLAKSGLADPLASVLPLVFSHLIVTVPELLKRNGGD